MANNDDFVREVARKALLPEKANDESTILYRQDVLKDCLTLHYS